MSNIKWFNYTEEKSKTDLYAHNESMLNLSQKEFIKELDLAWFNFFVKNAPNGRVLISNTYNLDFKRIMLVHLTPSFNEILKTGKVFASGGGLGAAVYCSPVHQDNTVHNIFEQYFFFQLPKNTKKKISAICIEITPDKENTTNVKNWGVDYTNFGEIECQTWKNLKPQIDVSFIKELEKRVFNQIMNNKELINTFVGYKLDKLSYGEFEQVYDNLFAKIPSLRFISYEVLAEYILLFQDNKKAYDYSFKGELYNLPHKKFISDLCPSMLKKFNMIDFFISLNKISQYLHSSDIFKQFNQEQFINFIKWRIGFYLKKISLSLIRDNYKDFDELITNHPSLIGQILYREFYDKNLFERERAKIIYDFWKKENIICPIYSILPKGEIGINPCLEDLGANYQVFEAEFNSNTKKLKILKELKIKLEPEIIDKSKTTIR